MIEPLVLLPGLMCDARVFAPQISALSRDRAVMVAPLTGENRVEHLAVALLPHLPQRFALAGLNMGGTVALELLRRAPDRISRICLISTDPMAETPAAAALWEPMIIGAGSGRLDDIMRDVMRPEYLTPGPDRLTLLNLVYDMARNLGPDVFVAQLRAIQRRPDQQGTLRRCKIPALVLCGEDDGLIPPKRQEFMANLMPNATLEIIPGAGHLPVLEQPELTTFAMQNWLNIEDRAI